jgi:hypothetical protein
MTIGRCRAAVAASLALLLHVGARGDLIVNSPLPITDILRVNPIIVSNDAGGDTATFLGAAEATIKGLVDQIWAQAGIDVQWLAPQAFNSTETLNGGVTTTGVTRPSTDLTSDPMGQDHETLGNLFGKRVTDAVNIFFVNVAAGFQLLGPGFAAGLAETPGDDISMFVGADLLTFGDGHVAVAHVIAHEIGHNLSLAHNDSLTENLLRSAGSGSFGQRLTAAQVAAALSSGRGSGLLAAVPEVNAFALLALTGALAGVVSWRRASKRAA